MSNAHHIRNPVEWGWAQVKGAGHALESGAHALHGNTDDARAVHPAIRRITARDIGEALRMGLNDFAACRTDVIFLCLIYPVAGLVLWRLAVGYDLVAMIFPLASGFALLGPVAAMGLYEMSRRRERGAHVTWADAFGVVRSPAFAVLLALSLVMVAVFLAWMAAAYGIYALTLKPVGVTSVTGFVSDVFTTPAGWAMTGIGVGVGFLFAVLAFTISVVSFPLLLDRDAGLFAAMATSVRAVRANPRAMALWGAVVAGGLVLGSLPALVGLAIVIPILGHATWHLYRRVIA